METVTAYCGLACDSCPIHLATLEKDLTKQREMRIEIAEQLSKIYGTTPKPEIISDCDGCKNINERLFGPCSDCKIRKCAIEKNIINCAYCDDFACEKLERHYKFDPSSREKLEEIRKNLKPDNISPHNQDISGNLFD
jgi:hypothetical protein